MNKQEFLNDPVEITYDDFHDRGWYIPEYYGEYYLFDDGIIRHGVDPCSASAFWESEKEAREFFNAWKNHGV